MYYDFNRDDILKYNKIDDVDFEISLEFLPNGVYVVRSDIRIEKLIIKK